MTRNIKEIVNQVAPIRADGDALGATHVCILLALYNGADTLCEQLTSLAEQSHRDWSLIVSDDASRDNWLEVLTAFAANAARGRTWLARGPEAGFAQNFLSLARIAGPRVPYAAFCDQDDVWKSDKLARAIARLKTVRDGVPALYCSRTIVCDAQLCPRGTSPHFRRPAGFRNALVQNIGGGNTMVMNRAALDIVQDTARHAEGIVSHDWWVYQVISGAGGTVFYDEKPTLYYRQHDGNAIGANDTLWASARRLKYVFNGRFRNWNDANTDALHRVRHWLTPDANATLDDFLAARTGRVIARLRALRRSGVYRQTRRGNLALWIAALTGRL